MHRFLRRAAKIAQKSPCTYRLGAVVVRGGSILSEANNLLGPLLPPNIRTNRHAEERALTFLDGRDLSGSTLYVVRIGARGDWLMSYPCPACMRAILKAGITKVVYTGRTGEPVTMRV